MVGRWVVSIPHPDSNTGSHHAMGDVGDATATRPKTNAPWTLGSLLSSCTLASSSAWATSSPNSVLNEAMPT